MSRSPADSALSRQDAAWAAIRRLRTAFTRHDLAVDVQRHARFGIDGSTLQSCLDRWTAAGILAHDGAAPKPQRLYELVRDPGAFTPRVTRDGRPVEQGRGTENIWRSMRMLKMFSVTDLAAHANTPDTPVKPSYVQSYVTRLNRAGYLRLEQSPRRGGRRGRARYRLIHDTGPRPPLVQRTHRVFDQNLQRVMSEEVDG